MISMLLDDVTIGFEEARGQAGEKVHILVVIDGQSGIQVRVPFTPDTAKAVSAHLAVPTIQVAHTLPPT